MIEVTESLFIEDVGQAKKILLALKEKNILTSLDDFGTGYSSLGVLSGLPISELKIDKVFVENILNNNQDLQLIKSIIKLGSGLGMSVIAEGVEEVEQVDVLSENGCDLFQGYYFSKPLNKKDLIVFMSK
jgi:EAL domain-containing protein (putative c-di-GMP-specific phosphodiesterase class I)